jgi:hypothetical protein
VMLVAKAFGHERGLRSAETIRSTFVVGTRCGRAESSRRLNPRGLNSLGLALDSARYCTLARHPLVEKSAIAVRDQPFRTREMGLPRAACAGWLAYGVDAENQKSCFIPLGALAFGVEETTIGDQMFFVIVSQRVGAGRLVGEHGAKVSFAHAFLRGFGAS